MLKHLWRSLTRRVSPRADTGAIDLASVMVGVIVAGAIAALAFATVTVVIPWSQDEAAKGSLDAVHYSESVAYAQNLSVGQPAFDILEMLIDKGLLPERANVVVATNSNRQCYLAIVRSATGSFFYMTYEELEPTVLHEDTVNGCLSPEAAWVLASELPGQ